MIRRSELPDEVRGPQEPWVIVCALVVIIMRYRKARALDIGRNDLAIDDRTLLPKAFAHEAFAAIYMIGRERGIGRSSRHLHGLVVNSCRIHTVAVPTAYTADIADIVAQERQDKMHPITRGDAAFTDMFASEDLLTNQGHHERMFNIVIEGITSGDVFESHTPGPGNDARIGRFEHTVHATILLL